MTETIQVTEGPDPAVEVEGEVQPVVRVDEGVADSPAVLVELEAPVRVVAGSAEPVQVVQTGVETPNRVVAAAEAPAHVVRAPAAEVPVPVIHVEGPPGPPGADGGLQGATFSQTAPAATWTFTHGLGHVPYAVQVVVGGEVVLADTQVDATTVVVTFASPTSGDVYLI